MTPIAPRIPESVKILSVAEHTSKCKTCGGEVFFFQVLDRSETKTWVANAKDGERHVHPKVPARGPGTESAAKHVGYDIKLRELATELNGVAQQLLRVSSEIGGANGQD